ncbi:hypothetical protein C8J56DRAFT_889732 [Mycena floridula]|nr:hypothetical protein C8J56DRAFT_889732 [Mycena floridula]
MAWTGNHQKLAQNATKCLVHIQDETPRSLSQVVLWLLAERYNTSLRVRLGNLGPEVVRRARTSVRVVIIVDLVSEGFGDPYDDTGDNERGYNKRLAAPMTMAMVKR